jgi:hypothetical protein
VPDFQKTRDREIIVGQRDVNDGRFDIQPFECLNRLSNFKRLSCNIDIGKIV